MIPTVPKSAELVPQAGRLAFVPPDQTPERSDVKEVMTKPCLRLRFGELQARSRS
jgi:hypothetical protein